MRRRVTVKVVNHERDCGFPVEWEDARVGWSQGPPRNRIAGIQPLALDEPVNAEKAPRRRPRS